MVFISSKWDTNHLQQSLCISVSRTIVILWYADISRKNVSYVRKDLTKQAPNLCRYCELTRLNPLNGDVSDSHLNARGGGQKRPALKIYLKVVQFTRKYLYLYFITI